MRGIESFRKHLNGFDGRYAVIGGAACEVWFNDRGLPFRATKDIDIVLIVESLDKAFTNRFFEYIRMSGYEHIQKGTGDHQYYRFYSPKREDAPYMLELFSRKPDVLDVPVDMRIVPVKTLDGAMSLSAILMDSEYYNLVSAHREIKEGVPYVSIPALICLKARAWLDLSARKSSGAAVDSRDIKKHRNDIFSLALIVTDADRVIVQGRVRDDVIRFLEAIEKDSPDMGAITKNMGVAFVSAGDALKALRDVLGVG